jgi:putative membrane protein
VVARREAGSVALNPELLTAPLISVGGVAYVAGVNRLWRRLGDGVGISRLRAAACMAGIVALGVALVSPLDAAAVRSLPAHMSQHLILDSISAPLLAIGEPLTAWSQLLRPSRRRLVRRAGAVAGRSASGTRWWTWALALVTVHTVVMVGWHIPVLYDAATTDNALHAVEHLTMVSAAVALWWLLLGSGRPRPAGGAVLVLFAATLPLAFLGLAMVLAKSLWYPAYPHSLVDQQVAGSLLWGAGGAVAVLQGAALFGAWLAIGTDDGRPTPSSDPHVGPLTGSVAVRHRDDAPRQ